MSKSLCLCLLYKPNLKGAHNDLSVGSVDMHKLNFRVNYNAYWYYHHIRKSFTVQKYCETFAIHIIICKAMKFKFWFSCIFGAIYDDAICMLSAVESR